MKPRNYPYPLPFESLMDFCHPRAGHGFAVPVRDEGRVMAANGYLAIFADRGAWLTSDFAQAGEDYLQRFFSLPWQPLDGPWRLLAEDSGTIYRRGLLPVWGAVPGVLAPSPVWCVAGGPLVRLSMLQLVGRLPRCEVHVGAMDRADPLFFRFSGGSGMIAYDPKLPDFFSYELFPQRRDPLTGEILTRQEGPKPSWLLPGWPPPEAEI